MNSIDAKLESLLSRIRDYGSAVVAFSGGIDSALVLKAGLLALGPAKTLAVTSRSASVAERELEDAVRVAAEIGARHRFVETREFDDPDYLANPTNRCYFCKTELYSTLVDLARDEGFDNVLSGVNLDDLGDFRPGLKAGQEHRVRTPLADERLTKADVRALAERLGLSIHDKPASPCLSSRVQYGETITPEKLRRIDAAEVFLRSLGFRECRVRHHETLARIEVPAGQVERLAAADVRAKIDAHFRGLGYQYVTVDLRGLRSGSMNEVLLGSALERHL